MRRPTFGRYAMAVLACNLFVVVWGGYVRASRSGNGCGNHWPMCNGVVVPTSPTVATLIEFTHRITSGLALMMVIGLVVLSRRSLDKGHPARGSSAIALGLMIVESLLGAGLVLLRLVAGNTSVVRAWYLAAHLTNTFSLVAMLALTAWWGHGFAGPRIRANARSALVLGVGIGGLLCLAISGGIAALGDTLFPARSLAEGFAQDLSPSAHVFLRLRIWHPILALAAGGFVTVAGWGFVLARRSSRRLFRLALAVSVLFALQLGVGVANVFYLAPVPIQLGHLLVADLLWIAYVLLCAEVLGDPNSQKA